MGGWVVRVRGPPAFVCVCGVLAVSVVGSFMAWSLNLKAINPLGARRFTFRITRRGGAGGRGIVF